MGWAVLPCAAGSLADPLVDSKLLCLTGIGQPMCPVVSSSFTTRSSRLFILGHVLSWHLLCGWVLVAWQLPTASSSWVCLGSRPYDGGEISTSLLLGGWLVSSCIHQLAGDLIIARLCVVMCMAGRHILVRVCAYLLSRLVVTT